MTSALSRHRLQVGDRPSPRSVRSVLGQERALGEPGMLVHLQFRRFAGCPVCNLHLQSFVRQADALRAAGVREIVVFHSPADALLPHVAHLPFDAVADPERRLYAAFGVETGWRALLDPRAWAPIARALAHALGAWLRAPRAHAPIETRSTRLGLPADFLLDADGRVRALKYGEYVDDQWSVAEVLALAQPQAALRAA